MMIYKVLCNKLTMKHSRPLDIESRVGGERFYDSNDY